MKLILGNTFADKIVDSIKKRVTSYHQQGLTTPHLAAVRVGQNPSSEIYVRRKASACKHVGIATSIHHLPEGAEGGDVRVLLEELSADRSVHGILLQLPLPKPLKSTELLKALSPNKDIDGLTALNQGNLALEMAGLFPCTPLGCMHLAAHYFPSFAGIRTTVIGNSALVGAPLSRMLLAAGASVTTLHSQSKDLKSFTRTSELVVVAAGHPHLVDREWIKEGAVVIDVGISRTGGKILGDVNLASLEGIPRAITPVPGGVGPMTIAMLLSNCLAAYQHLELGEPLSPPSESYLSCHDALQASYANPPTQTG